MYLRGFEQSRWSRASPPPPTLLHPTHTPRQVSCLEVHGSATTLGDFIELHALRAVFQGPRPQPLAISCLKTTMGHLEGAAGLAGVLKAVLQLQTGRVTPLLHLRDVAQPLPLEGWQVLLATEAGPLPQGHGTATAGVSSFGISGTNAHAVLRGGPVGDTAWQSQVLSFSPQTCDSGLPLRPQT